MAKLCPLFSGSEGNCYYIGSATHGILIDAGRSAKQITSALAEMEIDIKNIGAVFVTHEHTDHVKGLKTLAARNHIPVYATEGTLQALDEKNLLRPDNTVLTIGDSGTECQGMYIQSFPISHDCREGTGYVVTTADGRKTAFATDTGIVTAEMKKALKGCDTVVLESNYDEQLLAEGDYPYLLQQRILSRKGHLSNDDCAETAVRLVQSGTTRIILAHLSSNNNSPVLAEKTTVSMLHANGIKQNTDYLLEVAKPENHIKIVY